MLVRLNTKWDELDDPIKAFVFYHERCHMLGVYDEREADLCAVRSALGAGHLLESEVPEVIEWLMINISHVRAITLLEGMQ